MTEYPGTIYDADFEFVLVISSVGTSAWYGVTYGAYGFAVNKPDLTIHPGDAAVFDRAGRLLGIGDINPMHRPVPQISGPAIVTYCALRRDIEPTLRLRTDGVFENIENPADKIKLCPDTGALVVAEDA